MTSRAAAVLLLAASLAACKSEVVCTAGQAVCDGQCTSLQSDASSCGACGRSCGTGESCSAGLCCQGDQCPPAVYAACFNGNAVQGSTGVPAPVGAPVLQQSSGPISLAWLDSSLWVANAMSNTLNRMKVSPSGLAPDGDFPTVEVPISGGFADLEFLAERDGLLYASNAAVGSLLVVDPVTESVAAEIPLGARSYPLGIAFHGTRAYVALNGSNAVAVIDLGTRTLVGTIDLSALASPGKVSLPSRLGVSGDRIYVTLWNLDPAFYQPGNGLLAVIDAASGALVPSVNPIDLGPACQDPAGITVLGTTAWVACGFFAWDAPGPEAITGAAFVPVDVSGPTPVVGAAVPVELAAPGSLVFCNGTGFAGDRFSGDVLRFDPAARTVTSRGLVCPPTDTGSSFVADVACGR